MSRLAAAVAGLTGVGGVGSGGGAKAPPGSRPLEPLVRVLAESDDVAVQRDVLGGMHEALQGRRHVAAPRGWSAVYRKLAASTDPEVRQKALVLSLLFGDAQALESLRKT